ncbi:uncharacterized protein METZ01_LOCUS467862, partial [marine metagenome]
DTENPEDMERLQQILDDYWATKELENAGDIWEDEGESALDRHDPWNSIIHTTDELVHVLELVMFKDWTEAHLPGSDKLAPLLESGFPPFGGQSLLPRIPTVCLGDFLLPSVNESDSVPEWFCLGNWRTKRDLDSEILNDGFVRWRYKLLASRGSGKEQVLDPLSAEFGNFWTFGQPRGGQAGNAWGLVARIGSLIVDLRWHEPLLDDGQRDLAVSNQVIKVWNEVIWSRLEWLGNNVLEASRRDDVPS